MPAIQVRKSESIAHYATSLVQVIEVDPVVVQLAKTFFDVSEDASFEVSISVVPGISAAAVSNMRFLCRMVAVPFHRGHSTTSLFCLSQSLRLQ